MTSESFSTFRPALTSGRHALGARSNLVCKFNRNHSTSENISCFLKKIGDFSEVDLLRLNLLIELLRASRAYFLLSNAGLNVEKDSLVTEKS